MRIIVTIDLPDKGMNKLWVHKKAQELKRMTDYHMRYNLTESHGDINTTVNVDSKVEG